MTYTLKSYPAYKPSGVEWLGEIPEHWAMKCLKQLVQVNPIGGRAKKEETVTFLPMEAVSTNGLIDGTRIERRANCPDSLTEFQRRDVILAKITPCFENGKGAYLESLQTGKGVGSTEFHVFRPDRSLLLPGFLYYLVTNGDFRNYATAFMEGSAGQKRVTTPFVSNCKFPIPPKEEQHRIAAFLDQKTAEIDEAIGKKQRLIDLLKEQKAILINQAVTKGLNPNVPMRNSGVEWIGEVPAHWEILAIKRITSVPITDGPHETPELLDKGVPFISAEAIKNDRIDFTKRRGFISPAEHARFSKKYKPKRGDIYLIKSGATTGNIAFVDTDDEFNIWSPLAVIRPHHKVATTLFVFYFMKSRSFFQSIELGWSYGTQQNIGMNVIENLPIVRPPIDEQQRITAFLGQKIVEIDEVITKKQRQISLLQEYRTILIANVVTGKFDVREDAPRES